MSGSNRRSGSSGIEITHVPAGGAAVERDAGADRDTGAEGAAATATCSIG
jgi:hypothetical protein